MTIIFYPLDVSGILYLTKYKQPELNYCTVYVFKGAPLRQKLDLL